MFGKELFIHFTVLFFRARYQFYVCPFYPLGFEGWMWYLIVLFPDYCLSVYFVKKCELA